MSPILGWFFGRDHDLLVLQVEALKPGSPWARILAIRFGIDTLCPFHHRFPLPIFQSLYLTPCYFGFRGSRLRQKHFDRVWSRFCKGLDSSRTRASAVLTVFPGTPNPSAILTQSITGWVS